MGSPCLTPDAERIGSAPLISRWECCLSITLSHPRENVGEVLFHLPWKKAGLLTELNAFTMSSETSTQPEWWSLRRFSHTVHYILCSSWNTHTLNCTGEKKPGSFSLIVAHDSRADELVEDGSSYCNGSHTTILLGYWDKPCSKEVWSKGLWNELRVCCNPLT